MAAGSLLSRTATSSRVRPSTNLPCWDAVNRTCTSLTCRRKVQESPDVADNIPSAHPRHSCARRREDPPATPRHTHNKTLEYLERNSRGCIRLISPGAALHYLGWFTLAVVSWSSRAISALTCSKSVALGASRT